MTLGSQNILFLVGILLQVNSVWSQSYGNQLHFHSEFEKNAFLHSDSTTWENALSLLLSTDSTVDSQQFLNIKIQIEGFNNDKLLTKSARKVFYKTQASFLNHYELYASFSRVFSDSTFNCVSGTALLALVAEKKNIPFEIVEMPHHVYLKLYWNKQAFLAESTNPEFGFTKFSKHNLEVYAEDSVDQNPIFESLQGYCNTPTNGYRVNGVININQLAGLQYYNQAITMLEKKEFIPAYRALEKAYFLYPSHRIMAMLNFCLIETAGSTRYASSARTRAINKLNGLRKPAVALSSTNFQQ